MFIITAVMYRTKYQMRMKNFSRKSEISGYLLKPSTVYTSTTAENAKLSLELRNLRMMVSLITLKQQNSKLFLQS